jgi:2-dehydro-3-deoxyphosphogluconate aldolase / (4S)-4-hydroxy-2-oxoglutarate aldolase
MSFNAFNPISDSWRQLLQQYRVIAVIRSETRSQGLAMAKAVADGGIHLIEIPWNSDRPAELISQLREELPGRTIGTGTILNELMLQEAIACGAQFLFSPHVNLNLIQAAVTTGRVPIIPGALSPTEILAAWQAGASCVKVFPIQAVGGASYIKSLQGPLGQIPLIPTGGVTMENAHQFIEAGAIGVGLSGDLFPSQLVAAKDWRAIAQRVRLFLESFKASGTKK